MPTQGWKRLVAGTPWFDGQGEYPLRAYSEFMPPPRLGRKPYGDVDRRLFDPADPWGWRVSEYEESLELQPGLALFAQELLHALRHLGRGEPAHGIAGKKLQGNLYWPEELEATGAPGHERYVILLPLALSRTQDDKGRVRWTLFGGSEQGPARPFWRGFFTSPNEELPAEQGLDFFCRLLEAAYSEPLDGPADLHRAGFRIYSNPPDSPLPFWNEEPLPSWTAPYRWQKRQSLRGMRYLFTFCPFAKLPAPVRQAYRAGDLHLLPFPGSLLFFGAPPYLQLHRELPMALQIPLLHSFHRHIAPWGIRVPQSGWLHEARPDQPAPHPDYGPVRVSYRRTHRWARVHRHQDELAVAGTEDHVTHVLFSTAPGDLGLYDKPMARNSQIWTDDYRLLLDGLRASPDDFARASKRLAEGGLFGYRFFYPPMQVGHHAVYWQRPLVGYWSPEKDEPTLLPNAPLGYLTAYPVARPRLDKPIELWPRLLQRPLHRAAIELFTPAHEQHHHQTMTNIRKLLDARELLGERPLPQSFARQLLTLPKHESLDDWLASLPGHAADSAAGEQLADALRRDILPASGGQTFLSGSNATGKNACPPRPLPSLTFAATARRSFEKTYWKTIATLAEGKYRNKDNADCVLDPATQQRLDHHHRDLEALGDYLLAYYEKTIAAAGMTGRSLAGELPFRWQTDFDFRWSGGWLRNQQNEAHERDLIAVIPGRDRHRTVIMADHYDTAYMEDVYGKGERGGPRVAAAGADDNHSATAALMLAAPIFLQLAREGRLACDVWLVHLTGEEFPADCMGARHLCQSLIEGTLRMRLANGRWRDLSRTQVQGVYVLDMIAHNNDHDRDIFQICPGTNRQSWWLAEQAHAANQTWNFSAAAWNRRADRRGRSRGIRSADGATLPEIALHPELSGEIRPAYNPRSTLYNTDGQIFSDAGVPVVLFMEHYDINRQGYHDTHDTMANIDLDYGAALAAITIETVARAATEPPLPE